MRKNSFDNAINYGNPIVMSWIKDTIPKTYIVLSGKIFKQNPSSRSVPGTMRSSVGKYRQEMAQQFDDEKYGRRQLVENIFSVLKRKFSGDLKARIFLVQKKEIASKMIVCNIHTFLQFAFIEVFYQADFYSLFLE